MKKIILFLLFIYGLSLPAFSQSGNYDYRIGTPTHKKRTFKAPVIRIGTLTDSSFKTPVIVQPTILDTQAIYLVTLEIDSAYVLTDFDSLETETSVDTIQKIGHEIYSLGLEKTINDSDDNWEVIQEYLENSEPGIDSMNEETMAVADTQVFYVLTEKVDSMVVLNEASLDQSILADSMNVDTFYQVGVELFQDDLASSIEEEDWELIKEELLRDSVINIRTDDLTYEEYLDAELSKVPALDERKIETEKELDDEELALKKNIGSLFGVEEEIETDTFVKVDTPNFDPAFEQVNSRLSKMEEQLEAIRAGQTSVIRETEEETTSEEARVVPSSEIIELQKKIEALESKTLQETETQVQNSPELDEMKAQLERYKKQEEGEKINAENVRLKAEIESLRSDLNKSKLRVETPVVQVAPNPNSDEINQLKKEVASVNKNMEMMQQLLLQQQIIEALKNEPKQASVVEVRDTTELVALRKEIAELKASMSVAEKTPEVAVTVPVENNKGEVDTLRQQILNLQQELKSMKDVKPEPPLETVVIVEKPVEKIVEVPVEKPVETPVDVMTLIKGKEKKIVFFSSGSSKLTSEASGNVGAIAQLLLQYEELEVVLEAYTDSSGDPAKNLLLSKRRAESVKASIMKYGVSGSRIVLDFRGEDAQSDSDPAFGRRVEMILRAK